jgi:hypothetical protein
MKAMKAVCLLIVAFAVLALPAVSQGVMSKTVVRDLSAGPFPPPHVL